MRAFESLNIFTLIGSICPKACKYLDEKYDTEKSHDTEEWCKFEDKLAPGSKNDMRNFVNFNGSSGKSGNLHFDVLLLPIAHKVSA